MDQLYTPLWLVPTKVDKKWGYELVIVNNDHFCCKILHYNKRGDKSSKHYHCEKKELFRVISGSFMFRYNHESGRTLASILSKGDTIYLDRCVPHGLEALEDNSEMWEVSTPDDPRDIIRIEPGDNQL